MNVAPTGRIDQNSEGRPSLVLTRDFHAPIEDVWAAVTEPVRLQRWIGTVPGDPASGRVAFSMTAEGEGPAEDVEILECEPPRLLAVKLQTGWHLRAALGGTDGATPA